MLELLLGGKFFLHLGEAQASVVRDVEGTPHHGQKRGPCVEVKSSVKLEGFNHVRIDQDVGHRTAERRGVGESNGQRPDVAGKEFANEDLNHRKDSDGVSADDRRDEDDRKPAEVVEIVALGFGQVVLQVGEGGEGDVRQDDDRVAAHEEDFGGGSAQNEAGCDG